MWAAALAAEPAKQNMIGHFEAASFSAFSVAVGDVKEARRHAGELTAAEGITDEVLEAARAIEKCRDVECAAPAAAQLARTCAGCHVEGGEGPRPVGVEQLPRLGPDEQHAVAAMFVWIGIVTPHEQAYLTGLGGAVPPVDLDSPTKLLEMFDSFDDLVASATEARGWDERTGFMGQMFTTCADCHRLAGVDKRIKEEAKQEAAERKAEARARRREER